MQRDESLKQSQKAIAEYAKAIELNSGDSTAYDNRQLAYQRCLT